MSSYGVVRVVKPIDIEEMTDDGRYVRNTRKLPKGTYLLPASEFKRLTRDYPSRVKGKMFSGDNLLNGIKMVFDSIKQNKRYYPSIDSEWDKYYNYYIENYGRDAHSLRPDSASYGLNDLANKTIRLQELMIRAYNRQDKERGRSRY